MNTSQKCNRVTEIKHQCAVIMVGLPARGKTYMAKKLARYLNWIGLDAKVFNVGELRRQEAPHSLNNSDFFNKENKEAVLIRDKVAFKVLDEMINWINRNDSCVGIYDATNTTIERREKIKNHFSRQKNINLLFVESICNDNDVINTNVKEIKTLSPEYENVGKDGAIIDFFRRINYYEKIYQPIRIENNKNDSFLKIFDLGNKFIVNRINDHLQSRIVYYFMNIRVLPRVIYITRPGERISDIKNLIGVDDQLSERGIEYSKALSDWIRNNQSMNNLIVWTSYMKCDQKTAKYLESHVKSITKLKILNELDAGSFEGMNYDEIRYKFPEEFAIREADKYYYRFPAGESYHDLVMRLEPIIMELEKVNNVMLVCQQSVARCLLAYLLNKPTEELPYMDIPLHTIFKLTPVAYGCLYEKINLGIPAVDNYRPKPEGLVSSKSFDESRLKMKLTLSPPPIIKYN